jgi:hypothetical protein
LLARSNSDRSPLYDVRKHAVDALVRAVDCEVMFRGRNIWVEAPARLRPFGLRRGSLRYDPARRAVAGAASEGWWSQTGSNRRPHACKARALPAELWPRNQKTNAFSCSPSPRLRRSSLRRKGLPGRSAEREGWWAWEDLNFRPHAYQARALTN